MRHLDSSLGQLDRTSILGEQSSSSLAAFESAGSEMDVLNGLLGLGATGDVSPISSADGSHQGIADSTASLIAWSTACSAVASSTAAVTATANATGPPRFLFVLVNGPATFFNSTGESHHRHSLLDCPVCRSCATDGSSSVGRKWEQQWEWFKWARPFFPFEFNAKSECVLA